MKNGSGMFLTLGALLCAFGIVYWVGCEMQGPTEPKVIALDKTRPNDIDGIRVNGTESDPQHPLVRTYEAWFRGDKIPGPSPKQNFWTEIEAVIAYNLRVQGAQ